MTRERIGDAAWVVASLALAALAVKGHWSAVPAPVIGLAGALGSAALWWRRRRPVATGLVAAASYALSGNPLPILFGVYSGAAHAPRPRAWVFPVAGLAGYAAWSLIDAGRVAPQDMGAAALVALLLAGLGVYVATRRELADSWRDRAERADAERRLRDDRARADERTRIAREMHDVLAHKVSLIALHAGALELIATGDDRVREGAGLIRVTAREALEELREVLGVLQSAAPTSDLPDLPTLVAAAIQAGQPVTLHDEAGELPPATARVVYRVVQEGLTNARKHAPGAPVTVSLTAGDTLVVDVRNLPADGHHGLDLPGTGAGLIGLKERLRLVGGTVEAGPVDDGGWCLTAEVPR
ncbi:two-component sensor histidine kinase [Dactylosporangium vinaceum]|uniref:histidine kinase n=1 Tax=Dactylosporangium vinaceum TaxID=53362 RepID=A0ABV5LY29_9ACTN|nr:histidine kinase [Dactylosporangium vinaceum]UAB95780.1 two-component sensor histidine kinase [Dactylosporangium vinaceum]